MTGITCIAVATVRLCQLSCHHTKWVSQTCSVSKIGQLWHLYTHLPTPPRPIIHTQFGMGSSQRAAGREPRRPAANPGAFTTHLVGVPCQPHVDATQLGIDLQTCRDMTGRDSDSAPHDMGVTCVLAMVPWLTMVLWLPLGLLGFAKLHTVTVASIRSVLRVLPGELAQDSASCAVARPLLYMPQPHTHTHTQMIVVVARLSLALGSVPPPAPAICATSTWLSTPCSPPKAPHTGPTDVVAVLQAPPWLRAHTHTGHGCHQHLAGHTQCCVCRHLHFLVQGGGAAGQHHTHQIRPAQGTARGMGTV
jgi:hypothetical protein